MGCDAPLRAALSAVSISIHAPRVGCDAAVGLTNRGVKRFQSTHPVWGATGQGGRPAKGLVHFNPRTPCGVRRGGETDGTEAGKDFNPRTPCGVRHNAITATHMVKIFQSTHPVWGATGQGGRPAKGLPHFNPRTPCGVRPDTANTAMEPFGFQSTHPVWGATDHQRRHHRPELFQSTHPVWGATYIVSYFACNCNISIHAPRVGCDMWEFKEALPMTISIHAPRVGCDTAGNSRMCRCGYFNPRTPCGVRQQILLKQYLQFYSSCLLFRIIYQISLRDTRISHTSQVPWGEIG